LERRPDMGAWLGENVFALVVRVAGLEGLGLLVALVAAATLFVVHSFALRRTQDEAAALLAAAFAAACSIQRWRGRPDIFSILLFFLMLTMLEWPAGRRRRFGLFGLVVLWMNLHPGAIVAPLFIAARAFGDRGLRLAADARATFGDAALALVALSMTPWGPLESIELVRLTMATGPLVSEWRALWDQPFLDATGSLFGAQGREQVLMLALLGFVLWTRPRRRLLIDLGGLALALRSVRLLSMATPVFVSALATVARPRRRPLLLALAAVLLIAFPIAERWHWYRKTAARGDSPFVALYAPHYPVAAADFIADHRLEGRLFHPVRWGGYLGWRLAPRNRSAHDGRISLWGAERAAHMEDFLEPARREALRRELGFEILVLPPGLLRREEEAALGGRWLLVTADPVAAVYVDAKGEHAGHNLDRLRPR
ncbi:MAG: hypothetical protein KDB35_01025, partial [Acidimicrobiales bacterium]|nr:hypothetical protein [Acidimicrobiales bacterium]